MNTTRYLLALIVVGLTPAIAHCASPQRDLADPGSLTERAPNVFRARFETSAGDFVIEVYRDWLRMELIAFTTS